MTELSDQAPPSLYRPAPSIATTACTPGMTRLLISVTQTLGLCDKVGTVFTAGTVNWAAGLRPEAVGRPVEIITRKLLRWRPAA